MSRIMTMQEVVTRFVKSGSLVFLGGMQHGEPFAAVHEILRQRVNRLGGEQIMNRETTAPGFTANDQMSFCRRTIIVLEQSKRRFPEKVDFNT